MKSTKEIILEFNIQNNGKQHIKHYNMESYTNK